MTSEDILLEDIEKAIGRYMGVNHFPTEEWPEIARLMAEIVQRAYVYSPSPYETADNAKQLVVALGDLADYVAKVMV